MNKAKTDVALILAVQNGDEEAFNQLYEQYSRLVYFIAYEMCHNDADAKDILQETFIQVKKSINTLEEPENFKPWLNRIVINKCKNLFRARRTVELDYDDLWYQYHVEENRTYMLPEENLRKQTDQEVIHRLMQELNPAQREVLILRYFEHLSMKEIAAILEIPEGTVKTRLLYGKNHLRELIDAYEKENEVKLNFHVEGRALMLLYAYWYRHNKFEKGKPLVKHKQRKIENPVWNGVMAALCTVIIGCGFMIAKGYQQNYAQPPVSTTQIAYEDQARTLYFQLMDWACCRDDMETKTKAEFDAVMPLYQKMLATPSLYLERLKADHWIEDFETVYHKSVY